MLVLECAPKRGSTEPLAAPVTLSRSDAGGTELAEVPRLPSGCLMVQGALAVGDAAESVRKEAAGRRAAGEVAQSGKAIFRKTLSCPKNGIGFVDAKDIPVEESIL